MYDSKIALKTRTQLQEFSSKLFHDFSVPKLKFGEDMLFGIRASGDTTLSSIVRTFAGRGQQYNAENRLSRNLAREGREPAQGRRAAHAGRHQGIREIADAAPHGPRRREGRGCRQVVRGALACRVSGTDEKIGASPGRPAAAPVEALFHMRKSTLSFVYRGETAFGP